MVSNAISVTHDLAMQSVAQLLAPPEDADTIKKAHLVSLSGVFIALDCLKKRATNVNYLSSRDKIVQL